MFNQNFDKVFETLKKYRAVGRFENQGVPVELGRHNRLVHVLCVQYFGMLL